MLLFGLFLDGTGCEAAHKVLGSTEEEDEQGEDGTGAGKHQCAIIGATISNHGFEQQWQSIEFLAFQNKQCLCEFVPLVNEIHDPQRGVGRQKDRRNNSEEDGPFTAAVDAGRFHQGLGNIILAILTHPEDTERVGAARNNEGQEAGVGAV